ncbi:Lipoxygenase C-terminal domain superfamily [Arabidopsis thaliana x Arabidopsis arenosa]|uniref:Lipoxygenase C-terminal domain superfamily n=1 Tax=Arabidopsis thaliana x Arabidopsis arenosa TaxID=1240361 RepID=A0A8T2BKY8_9BRAS|nr:Lipoxygenase C-terminal domain superfamily [Arabidopsis thaliana x Arabidopsis arenosa]
MFVASPVKTNFNGVSLGRSPAFPALPRRRSHRVPISRQVRAVISREEKAVDQEESGKSTNKPVINSSPFPWQRSKYTGSKTVTAFVKIRKKIKEKLTERFEHQLELLMKAIGQGMLIQLVSEEIDPDTGKGRRSLETPVLGLPKAVKDPRYLEFTADFTVPFNFGKPGAILVTNLLSTEICLSEIIIKDSSDTILFPGHTWIHSRIDNPQARIIFRSQPCLPSETPDGIKELREKDLVSVRGDGKGERKPHERIYDYDVYNDLGDPRKKERVRPVLGVPETPYPRRCRTGRPLVSKDPPCESRGKEKEEFYVPRDEVFEEIKRDTFRAGRFKALFHNLVPSISAALSNLDIPFTCFSDIDNLYKSNIVLGHTEPKDTGLGGFIGGFMNGILNVTETLLKYDTPAVIKWDRFAWLRDNEFGRQALAGVNPVNIELLKELPIRSKLDPALYGPQESVLTEEVIAREVEHYGTTIEKALEEKRLFLVDYHDMLLPFVEKINSIKEDPRKTYASRTIFYYSKNGALRPLAIELSLPPTPESENKFVYTHGHDATTHWIWKLAKAHVCSNDAGVHQLVNHWLRTHAAMEPYIIATNRQLSTMHPVYKLLHPHMRYTLEINARARKSLINGGGIIESCFTPGKYAMELSSAAYKSMWRFDMEGLPADLIRRGMAEEDSSAECGVKLVIDDYPYAADGLLIWKAIKDLVESYVKHFYSDPKSITSDLELQAWWDEIKNKGHYDKKDEPWWPKLNTTQDLSQILTNMIWIASGQHAAINFGQYPFGGYVPNRPTLLRKLIPQETDPDYEMFMRNPQYSFLSSLPTQLQATKVMAVQETLSTHSPDEEYLIELSEVQRHWFQDEEVVNYFNKFSEELVKIEKTINERNKDKKLKNRTGAGMPPYELLLPTSPHGVTGRGIPNSISI